MNNQQQTATTPDTLITQDTSEVDPILTNDMTDVRPDAPLIPKNVYPMEVVKMEQKTSEKSGNHYINVQLKTIEPITSVTGEPLPAGMTFFGRISITPTEKLTKAAIQRGMKRFMVCFGQPTGALFPFTQWIGKVGKVSIGFSKKSDEYPEDRNEVKDWAASKA